MHRFVKQPVALSITPQENLMNFTFKTSLATGLFCIGMSGLALAATDMPGMTMVFKASDANLLKNVKQGDKILFRAEKTDAGFMVVRLEQAK